MKESADTTREESVGVGLTRDVVLVDDVTSTATVLAEVLAGVVERDDVLQDAHFFDDLGANSMMMTQFCARLRKRGDVPPVSIKDVYRNPTVRLLAITVDARREEYAADRVSNVDAALSAAATDEPRPAEPTASAAEPAASGRSRSRQYALCGAWQALIFVGYSSLSALLFVRGFDWVVSDDDLGHLYLRSVVLAATGFVALVTLPVLAKWVLVGRWTVTRFPLWGGAYLRFWTVKALLHANPMVLLVGSPLYVLYLRALGARIGPGVTILSRSVPVCTDLLTIGSGTIVRKDSFLLCYRAVAGHIETGSVTLGQNVYVGEKTVLDIDTRLGDGAQLGHTSALQPGQSVPAGERWHGSPAEPTDVDYLRVAPTDCGTRRRITFGLAGLLQLLLVTLPVAVGGSYAVVTVIPSLGERVGSERVTSPQLYVDAAYLSTILLAGFLLLGLGLLLTVPRLLQLAVRPDRTYPLYGLAYSLHRGVGRITNVRFFAWLFGDSSYVVHYLRALGYDLSHVHQTGSNFGTEVQHETPYLVTVGSGTMVADGLSVINADYSSTSFRISRTTIGSRSFLGNNIAYPVGARIGEDCLLATKVMVPLDGDVRSGVGLLGSPPFEIPRSVDRDLRFDHFRTGQEFTRRLAAKNRYNLRSMALFLLVRWGHVLGLTVLSLVAYDSTTVSGHAMFAVIPLLSLGYTTAYFIVLERVFTGRRPLEPRLCSIYEPYFWWHERLWKVPDRYLNVFNGTPFKSLVWRLLGVRIGARVFDDGAYITERTLTTIGSDATLNVASKLQCHSQEDGTFKSDRSTVGARSTLGVGAFVHYGVTVGEDAVLAADSFLMKGEEIPPRGRWAGNPAAESRESRRPTRVG